MKANPGGQIPPSEVIGRDELVRRLWRILDRQSLVLTAERRIGKTCVVTKMISEAPHDKLPVYHDLENVRTPMEFVEITFRDVEGYLGRLQRKAARARMWLAHLTGMEIGELIKFPDAIASHWKTLLVKIIEDLIEHQDCPVVFFWDELPLMLDNMRKNDGERTAMEVLDTLRSLRQMNSDLRMVFTGSIGLHSVITSLRRAGYANDPTNDMYTEEVPPLSPHYGDELAYRLIEGENIQAEDLQATAHAIAEGVDYIPFFAHHVVDQMARRGGAVNVEIVRDIIDSSLVDPLDRWHLRYYCERINTYYADDERPFAFNLLDILSTADHPLAFNDLFDLLKSHLATEDVETARRVLTLLQRDHYIIQESSGAFRFRFSLIKRSWRFQRGLAL